ncbi:MAG: T9SS type A sorting domain-containing protein [Bacteroidetes bacterium]|nr:T9SS type A sorting domain-containing protein [Bacteroidota bacterium]
MKFKMIYTLFTLAGLAFLFWNNSSGAAEVQGQDRTNSPLSNAPCTACHSSGAYSPSVALEVLKDGESVQEYIPGEAYTMRVTANHTGSPASFGFQAVALAGADDLQAGEFSNPADGIQITPLDGRQYPEHSRRNESNVFEVEWTAPVEGSGEVRFYSSVVAANDGAGSGGDGSAFLNDPVVLTEAVTSSREQEALLPELAVFPNPASERLQVQWESQERTAFRVEVYDLNGRLLLQQPQQSMPGVQSTVVDLSNLPQGMYHLRTTDGQRQNVQRFVKQ